MTTPVAPPAPVPAPDSPGSAFPTRVFVTLSALQPATNPALGNGPASVLFNAIAVGPDNNSTEIAADAANFNYGDTELSIRQRIVTVVSNELAPLSVEVVFLF